MLLKNGLNCDRMVFQENFEMTLSVSFHQGNFDLHVEGAVWYGTN